MSLSRFESIKIFLCISKLKKVNNIMRERDICGDLYMIKRMYMILALLSVSFNQEKQKIEQGRIESFEKTLSEDDVTFLFVQLRERAKNNCIFDLSHSVLFSMCAFLFYKNNRFFDLELHTSRNIYFDKLLVLKSKTILNI